MSKISLTEAKLLAVCSLVKEINSSGPVKTNSEAAKAAVSQLGLIVEELKELIGANSTQILKFHISKGGGMFPLVVWIAITKENTKPSKDRSVAICFDKKGLGIVAGVLLPTGRDANFNISYRGEFSKLNVDGRSEFTKYNDRFINPKEFLVDDFAEVDFINHLLDSLSLFNSITIQ